MQDTNKYSLCRAALCPAGSSTSLVSVLSVSVMSLSKWPPKMLPHILSHSQYELWDVVHSMLRITRVYLCKAFRDDLDSRATGNSSAPPWGIYTSYLYVLYVPGLEAIPNSRGCPKFLLNKISTFSSPLVSRAMYIKRFWAHPCC